MGQKTVIDMERLKADMIAHVERVASARSFSLAVTDGKNPDFFRNFINDGRDKRISADVFIGIVSALGRNPLDYVQGTDPKIELPSEAVLISTFAILLHSLGIDPYQDALAQKLGAQFPDALRRTEALHKQVIADPDESLESENHASDEANP